MGCIAEISEHNSIINNAMTKNAIAINPREENLNVLFHLSVLLEEYR